MINHTSCPIILPNMKVIRPMTTEELHLQSKAGRTNEQTSWKTICPPYYLMWGIKICKLNCVRKKGC